MEYQKGKHAWIVRRDKGEEIVERLLVLAKQENIRLAGVNGLGAVGDVTVGVYSPETKQYRSNVFQGDFEIVSLHGTLTTKDGEPYGHFHMSFGDGQGRVFGGHVNRAEVRATCELVLQVLEGTGERAMDEEIGLNLMAFG